MTNNGFAADFLQILLGWLQGLFNGVWALFSGGSGGSVLKWFSENWLTLLVAMLIFGFVTDTVVYMIRWRPFWWWFRKKRMVIDDEVYDDYLGVRGKKKGDGKRVVPSTIVKRTKKAEDNDDSDDDIFEVKKKTKSRDPFAVDYSGNYSKNIRVPSSRRKSSR